MAKQVGPIFFTGTIDGIIFYKLGDQYYSRSKGSYKSAKHMRRNPKYQRTMANADRFGEASTLTQAIYYHYLPRSLRKQGLFGELTGLVYNWLKEGQSKEEATELLIAHCKSLVESSFPLAPEADSNVVKKQAAPSNVTAAVMAPAVKTPLLHAPTKVAKQARYLSKWKVKRNGQLHIPKTAFSVCLSDTALVEEQNPSTKKLSQEGINMFY